MAVSIPGAGTLFPRRTARGVRAASGDGPDITLGQAALPRRPAGLPTGHEPIVGQPILEILSAAVKTVRGSHGHRDEPPPCSTIFGHRSQLLLTIGARRFSTTLGITSDPRPCSARRDRAAGAGAEAPDGTRAGREFQRASRGQPTGEKRQMPPVSSPDPAFRDQGAGQRHGLPAPRRSGLRPSGSPRHDSILPLSAVLPSAVRVALPAPRGITRRRRASAPRSGSAAMDVVRPFRVPRTPCPIYSQSTVGTVAQVESGCRVRRAANPG